MKWLSGKVLHGQKIGKILGYPTVNLNPEILPQSLKKGIYASFVKYKNKTYKGALFFGSRIVLGEEKNVLEIFILDFNLEIHGETIEFCIKDFIRGVQDFSSMEELSKQIRKDVLEIGKILN